MCPITVCHSPTDVSALEGTPPTVCTLPFAYCIGASERLLYAPLWLPQKPARGGSDYLHWMEITTKLMRMCLPVVKFLSMVCLPINYRDSFSLPLSTGVANLSSTRKKCFLNFGRM